MGLANLGSESETCVGSRVPLVGVSISFEKNFYWLPFTPPPPLVCRIGPSKWTILRVVGGVAAGYRALSEAFVHHQALRGAWNEGLLHYRSSCLSDHGTSWQMEDSYDSSLYNTLHFRGCHHQRRCLKITLVRQQHLP
jgi:hypothetical protein